MFVTFRGIIPYSWLKILTALSKHMRVSQKVISIVACLTLHTQVMHQFQDEIYFPGLAVPVVGVNAFCTVKDLIDKMLIVK